LASALVAGAIQSSRSMRTRNAAIRSATIACTLAFDSGGKYLAT
jgi:hypothetical protein